MLRNITDVQHSDKTPHIKPTHHIGLGPNVNDLPLHSAVRELNDPHPVALEPALSPNVSDLPLHTAIKESTDNQTAPFDHSIGPNNKHLTLRSVAKESNNNRTVTADPVLTGQNTEKPTTLNQSRETSDDEDEEDEFYQNMKQDNDKLYSFYYDKNIIQYPGNIRGYKAVTVHKSKQRVRLGFDYKTRDNGVVIVIAVLKERNGKPAVLVVDSANEILRLSLSAVKDECGPSSTAIVKVSEKRSMQFLEESEESEPLLSPQTPRHRNTTTRSANNTPAPPQSNTNYSIQPVIARLEMLERESKETKESIQKLSRLIEQTKSTSTTSSIPNSQYPMFLPYPQIQGFYDQLQPPLAPQNKKQQPTPCSRSSSPKPAKHRSLSHHYKRRSESDSASSDSRSHSNSPPRHSNRHSKRRRSRSPDRQRRSNHSPTRYDRHHYKKHKHY